MTNNKFNLTINYTIIDLIKHCKLLNNGLYQTNVVLLYRETNNKLDYRASIPIHNLLEINNGLIIFNTIIQDGIIMILNSYDIETILWLEVTIKYIDKGTLNNNNNIKLDSGPGGPPDHHRRNYK